MIDQFGVFDTSLYFAAFGGNYLGYNAGLTLQGAENLASTYLRGDPIYGGIIYDDPVYGIRKTITGPGGGISVFDPHAIGEYGWALRVSDGTVSGQVSMLVNTVQPVPLPSAFPMLALALMCLALARQRRIGR